MLAFNRREYDNLSRAWSAIADNPLVKLYQEYQTNPSPELLERIRRSPCSFRMPGEYYDVTGSLIHYWLTKTKTVRKHGL
jgi:hypothetical protein